MIVQDRTQTSYLAEKILKAVLKRKELESTDFYVEVLRYESKDEFGYCLEVNEQKICFARSAINGDHVVIYSGHKSHFSDNFEFSRHNKYHFNVPNMNALKTHFMYNDLLLIAKHIAQLILQSESTYKLQKAFEVSNIKYPLPN